MNNKGNSKRGNCLDIQEKLFDLSESGKEIESNISVKNHVAFCQNCQRYLDNLSIIKDNMRVSPSDDLKPNPQILKNIIAYKNIKSGLKKKNQKSFWETMRSIFEFRVPVYQALSGAAVVLILFIYVSNTSISPSTNAKYIEYSGTKDGTKSSELYAIDSLNYSNPGRGRNAKEDSVLISFLVPTL